MIGINIKDVDHGDALIFDWQDSNGISQIGILDCCKNNGNPILAELKARNIKNIHLFIISHFHEDHYSGFIEILKHCKENSITITYLCHTGLELILKSYIHTQSTEEQIRLKEAFLLMDELIDLGLIIYPMTSYDSMQPFQLTSKIKLCFLSPDYRDYRLVRKQSLMSFSNHSAKVEYNYIAAITCIYSDSEIILFPSDSELKSHERIMKLEILKRTLILAQAPHHGSDNNFLPDLWNGINRDDNCPVVFSVGSHQGYKLPKKTLWRVLINWDIMLPQLTVYTE